MNEIDWSRENEEAVKEVKSIKADDTRTYPKVEPKWYTDNDIREDRTYGWT